MFQFNRLVGVSKIHTHTHTHTPISGDVCAATGRVPQQLGLAARRATATNAVAGLKNKIISGLRGLGANTNIWKLTSLVAIISTTTITSVVHATDRFVPQTYATISAAVAASQNGDTITVSPGTYIDSVSFAGKNIIIKSSGGAAVTTVKATIGQRAFMLNSSEPATATLDGFTITRVAGQIGGGIEISSSATIKNCLITDTFGMNAPGLYISGGSPKIQYSTFIKNGCGISGYGNTYGGSAITISAGNATIQFCSFDLNLGSGSAVMIWPSSANTIIEDCNFDNSLAGGSSNQYIYNYGTLATLRRVVCKQGIGDPVWGVIFGWRDIRIEDSVFEGFSYKIIGNSAGAVDVVGCRFSNNAGYLFGSYQPYGAKARATNCYFCHVGSVAPCCFVDNGGNTFTTSCNTSIVPTNYSTIQAAINAAPTSGWTIQVAPGTYNEAIDFKGKAITVKATGARASTIIDGTGLTTSVVRAVTGETSATVLQGFTIRNGAVGSKPPWDTTLLLGGGLYIERANPIIRDCAFTTNHSAYGGGIYALYSNSLVENCTFTQNSASSYGGGIQFFGGSPIIRNCVITNNTCLNRGGGIHLVQWNVGASTLDGCTITGNSTNLGEGGGVSLDPQANAAQKMLVSNCTITNNTAHDKGGGLWATVNPANPKQNVMLNDNTICNNTSVISKRENVWALFEDGGNTICDCLPDVSGDGDVDTGDVSYVLLFFGEPTDADFIQPDQDMSGLIDTADVSLLLLNIGACP